MSRSRLSFSVAFFLIAFLALSGPIGLGQTKPPAQKPGSSALAPSVPGFDFEGALKTYRARNIGPANMGGRTVDFAVPDRNTSIIYAAVGPSGLWKSSNAGITWEPSFVNEATVSVGAVAVAQSAPDIVWVGSGEATARNSVAPGDGVYKSEDAGRTWKNMGLAETRFIGRICVDPTNPDVVFAGAQGHLWGPNEERGVYRTTDGGKTWKKVLYIDKNTGCSDLAMDPSNPEDPLCRDVEVPAQSLLLLQRRRDERPVQDGRRRRNVEQNGGRDSLRRRRPRRRGHLPLPSRGRLHPHRARHGRRPLSHEQQGRDLDPDVRQADLRPDELPAVLLQPPDRRSVQRARRLRLFRLGVRLPRRRPDLRHDRPRHALRPPRPLDRSLQLPSHHRRQRRRDRHLLGRRPDLSHGPIRRLGRDLQRRLRHARSVLGQHRPPGQRQLGRAVQFAGPERHPEPVLVRHRRRRRFLRPDRSDRLDRSSTATSRWAASSATTCGPSFPRESSPRRRSAKSPPVQLEFADPSLAARSNVLYFGGNFLFRSRDKGRSWEKAGPDLTTNDPKKKIDSGGPITIDNTGAEIHCTILSISESPLKKGLIWVGTDDGQVQVTRDDGKTWTNVTKTIKGLGPDDNWVTRVEASHFAEGAAYISISRHQVDDYKPYIYKPRTSARPGPRSPRTSPLTAISTSSARTSRTRTCSSPDRNSACSSASTAGRSGFLTRPISRRSPSATSRSIRGSATSSSGPTAGASGSWTTSGPSSSSSPRRSRPRALCSTSGTPRSTG